MFKNKIFKLITLLQSLLIIFCLTSFLNVESKEFIISNQIHQSQMIEYSKKK